LGTRHRTETNKTKQHGKLKDDRHGPTKKRRWTWVLGKGKQFLLIIRHPPCLILSVTRNRPFYIYINTLYWKKKNDGVQICFKENTCYNEHVVECIVVNIIKEQLIYTNTTFLDKLLVSLHPRSYIERNKLREGTFICKVYFR